MISLNKMAEGIRWAFNFANWHPTRTEWLLAGRCIQAEEKTRISRFVFTKDAKAAMIGRLMLRKFLCQNVNIPYEEIRLERTDKGKPILNSLTFEADCNWNFNISHHGSFVVLAAQQNAEVGVDVMKVEDTGVRNIPEFFRTMKRQFTDNEWRQILMPKEKMEQLSNFYRFWCLKESYVKAVGIGIGFSLQRLDFTINSNCKPNSRQIYLDTLLTIDSKKAVDWIFEETVLDDDHWVSVALSKNDQCRSAAEQIPIKFEFLSLRDLMSNCIPWQPEDEDFWIDFNQKDEKPK